MGKNHRHKKQVKAEKAKTKLKGAKTKFLPKGQNVTDVSFKVKPIVLPEQLRPSTGSDPLSTRKLTLKDVLSRLKHHNVLIKVDNCQQLKELIKAYSKGALRENLSQILRGVCPLVLDVEPKVRREAIKVIDCILHGITFNDVGTFFYVFSTFLRCSMTHIDPNVQEDSLLLLDALLDHAPTLVALNAGQILPNFFILISKLKGDSKPTRTLTQNLKSKQTSVRWRIRVLGNLEKIFETVYSCDADVIREITKVSAVNTALYVDKYAGRAPINFFSDDAADCCDAEEPVAAYVRTLVPLLHETWAEVAPDPSPPGPVGNAVVLKEDASDTLTCVLNVLYHSWHLGETLDRKNKNSQVAMSFKSKAMGELIDALLKTFPYAHAEREPPEKCLRQNLLFCNIFCVTGYAKKFQRKKSEVVTNYLNDCLSSMTYVDCENLDLIISLFKVIPKTKELVRNALRFYLRYNRKIMRSNSVELLVLLCDVVEDFEEANEGDIFDLTHELPRLLLMSEVHAKTLNFLLTLVKRNLPTARRSFREHFRAVLDNSLRIRIVDVADPYLGVLQILSLYYYVPLRWDDLGVLALFGENNPKYLNFVNYVIAAQPES